MRNFSKKLITIFTAGAIAVSVGALAACEASFTPLGGDFSSGEVVSNGGFVAEKGNYVYQLRLLHQRRRGVYFG